MVDMGIRINPDFSMDGNGGGPSKFGVDEEEWLPYMKSSIPENIRINANKALPSYSQLQKVEVMDKPFEKTPKMSIKRFMYK